MISASIYSIDANNTQLTSESEFLRNLEVVPAIHPESRGTSLMLHTISGYFCIHFFQVKSGSKKKKKKKFAHVAKSWRSGLHDHYNQVHGVTIKVIG